MGNSSLHDLQDLVSDGVSDAGAGGFGVTFGDAFGRPGDLFGDVFGAIFGKAFGLPGEVLGYGGVVVEPLDLCDAVSETSDIGNSQGTVREQSGNN